MLADKYKETKLKFFLNFLANTSSLDDEQAEKADKRQEPRNGGRGRGGVRVVMVVEIEPLIVEMK